MPDGPGRISVVGVPCDGSALPAAAAAAVAGADMLVGAPRHLEGVAALGAAGPPEAPGAARRVPLGADIASVLDLIAGHRGQVCVLATGDPGFFGIVRPLADRFGPGRLEVHPGVSSVTTAFARLGLPWDDAVVVSAHGRPRPDAVDAVVAAVRSGSKVAVLTSPDIPPEALGRALQDRGPGPAQAHVCSRLGTPEERVVTTDVDGLAGGRWDPRSVVVVVAGAAVTPEPSVTWGRPATRFRHRAGMVTKAEVRAVVLGKLRLPPAGVLWDVGAGSASVAVEAAALAPGLRAYAVEPDPDAAGDARANASTFGAAVQVVEGRAPGALAGLPDPDRVFVGGGGLTVLESARARLRPGGQAVATFAALDRAAAAAELLGHLVQVGVARGERLPDGGLRLVAGNPVFVVWGPEE